MIVEAAVRSNTAFGHKTLLTGASTDANVPMSLGIPAIIIGGGGKTGGFHALSEWIDVTDGWKGAQNALVTVLGLVGVQGVSEPLAAQAPAAVEVDRIPHSLQEPIMGLLDSVLGQVLGGAQQQPQDGGIGSLGGWRAGSVISAAWPARSAGCSPTTASWAASAAWSRSSSRPAWAT